MVFINAKVGKLDGRVGVIVCVCVCVCVCVGITSYQLTSVTRENRLTLMPFWVKVDT